MNDIERLLRTAPASDGDLLLLVIGLDGVLLDYEGDPEAAYLSPEQCTMLSGLAARDRVVLGLISGRRLDDLKARAALPASVFYIGLHGLEVEGPGFWMRDGDAFDSCRALVRDIGDTLKYSLASVAGVRVEDKGAAIAVHTREARSSDAVWARLHCLSTAARVAPNEELRVVRGNHVIELIPNVPAPRAAAVGAIQQHLEARTGKTVRTLYLGEAGPDDDALASHPGHTTSGVGGRPSQADHQLASPAEVWRLLQQLSETLEARAAG